MTDPSATETRLRALAAQNAAPGQGELARLGARDRHRIGHQEQPLARQPQGILFLRRNDVLQARRVLTHFMAQFKQVIT